MYIKSIVLDGFKSYGNRVEVTGFDPEFNAITGLNGTGKSNILDSICFVLGITNLSNVRAGSLQELIYKHGQAGIIKATVSITFDNRDKRQCPIGYENHDEITVTRQVVMGGKNKYLINGINVQNKRVSDMFCSVQLNVNNPHFLIMQGRITKVLNMKPPEILSMVEEAAGTRMYEAKKQAAQKTIEKKDAKLRELNDIIKEDIAPKLQKLQDERYQFQEYQKVVRELENLSRLHTAFTYVQAQAAADSAARCVAQAQRDIAARREDVAANCAAAQRLDDRLAALNRTIEEESGGGSALGELQASLGAAERKEAACAAEERAAREAQSAQATRARLLTRALHDDTAALRAKEEELQTVSARFEGLKNASEASAAALAEAQARFLAVSTGLEDGSESLQDQLMAAKREASEAATRMAQSRMQREHAQSRLRTLEREAGAGGAQHSRDQRDIDEHQTKLERLQEEMSRLEFDEARCGELHRRARELQGAARARRGEADALSARLQRCDFRYQPPQPDFAHDRVAGTVCRLLDVRDPKYCTALETAAGGRLYNVVVDTEVTSKLLLERGQLQTRTTIIPLNKISTRVIDRDTLRVAQEVGGGAERVELALDLVSFPERVRAAMGWVFGGTLVCADLDTARRVTFHPRVRCRCVTLDGDVVDPAGTLSGGARIKGGSVLLQLQELKRLEAEARAAEEALAACSSDLAGLQRLADKHNTIKQKVEVSSHALQVLRSRVAATAHAQLHAEIDTLRQQVEELGAALERDQRVEREAAARAADLQAKVHDIKGHRERVFKKAEEALRKAKLEAEKDSDTWKRREQEFETLKLEVEELRQAAAAGERQLGEGAEAAADLLRALAAAQESQRAAAENVKGIQAQIKQKKAEIASKNAEAAQLARETEALARRNAELELAIKELELSAEELQEKAVDYHKKIRSLEEKNLWISTEREYFGAAGGLYDFEARGAGAAAERLAQLRERRDRLARGLNARAHTLLGKEEEQYQDVMRKKKIVEADRAKLVQVMAELDEKKKHTLIAACEQVNRDFGSIFSSLLPGAQARLTPPPGRTVLDGLEVKVGFNLVWKESLGELSGGQRSLVALSLVLAMLLFKPAPLYILDEVDAALDLSHTQNIGQMLKEHFKHSQFIIVSLKDGMFNNANVLFRTRFVDGMSAVQRSANTPR